MLCKLILPTDLLNNQTKTMMKKNFYFLMLSALVVSCTSDELTQNESSTVVGFHALTSGVTSRTVNETNSLNLKDEPFDVYAFTQTDGKLFMGKHLSTADYDLSQGVEIKHDGVNWDYANPEDRVYWPIEKLDFFAFHPKSNPLDGYSVEVFSAQKQVVRYSVPTAAKYQKDLMYAISRGVDKNTNAGKVKLMFRHALSQVCFKAKTELKSMSVDIEDLKIHNIAISGDLTLPKSGTEISMSDWNTGEKKHILYEPKELESPLLQIGTEAKEITAKMYLPQELTKWTPESNTIDLANTGKQSYLSVLCKIRQNGVYLWGSKERALRLFVPFGVKWEPGKRYVYTLIFGGGYDDKGNQIIAPVKFDVTEQPWQDIPYDVDTDTNVNVG